VGAQGEAGFRSCRVLILPLLLLLSPATTTAQKDMFRSRLLMVLWIERGRGRFCQVLVLLFLFFLPSRTTTEMATPPSPSRPSTRAVFFSRFLPCFPPFRRRRQRLGMNLQVTKALACRLIHVLVGDDNPAKLIRENSAVRDLTAVKLCQDFLLVGRSGRRRTRYKKYVNVLLIPYCFYCETVTATDELCLQTAQGK
jgi:hypothetical protein